MWRRAVRRVRDVRRVGAGAERRRRTLRLPQRGCSRQLLLGRQVHVLRHRLDLLLGESHREEMALNERAVSEGVTGAPVFDEAVAYLDCEVRQTHDLGTHTLFVGEVIDAGIRDIDARVASMSDTRMKYGGVKRH